MEFTPRPFEANEPEQTGESKTPKKRKKKTTRVPLPVTKSELAKDKNLAKEKYKTTKPKKTAEPEKEPAPETAEPAETSDVAAPEAEDRSSEQDDTKTVPERENLEDTEVAPEAETEKAPEDQTEELILPEVEAVPADDEGYQGELLIDHTDEPPRVAPPFPFVVNVPPPFAEQPTAQPTAEAAEATSEPEPEDSLENYAVLPPAPEEIIARPNEPEAPPFVQVPASEPERGPSVSEQEAREREYYARKRGLSRGVVAGGLVGWWAGRRGRAAAEREAKAAIENHDRIIGRLAEERSREREEHQRQGNLLKRAQAELRDLRTRVQERLPENRPARPEAPTPVPPVAKAFERVLRTEAAPTPPVAEAANRPMERTQETAPENLPITEETYAIPEGRRVETSAWHRIEMDEKTGQVVDRPSVSYGEAFKREQRQERLAHDAAAAQAAVSVGMTAVMSGTEPTPRPLLATQPERASLPSLRLHSVRRETVQAARQIVRNTTQPLTWLAALIIVVLLFAVGIIR